MVKSFKELSWNVTEEEYRADPAISYSTLARFHREGFENIDHLFDTVSSSSLTFGSMVDTLLTDGEQAFNDRFYVSTQPAIEPAIAEIVKTIFLYEDKYNSLVDVPTEMIEGAINYVNYQPRWKMETRVNNVLSKGASYYDSLILSNGKEIVSSQERDDAFACVDILRTDPKTKYYFAKDNPFDEVERLYQLKFKGEYEGIAMRCMADLIIVDHKNKIVIPCDLKTSFKPEYKFYKSFIEWRYYIQAQSYWYQIRAAMDKDPYFKDFKLLDYRFIVICNKTRNPLVWEWPFTQCQTDIEINGVIIPNWRGIIKDLNYYLHYIPKTPIGIVEGCNDLSKWIGHD